MLLDYNSLEVHSLLVSDIFKLLVHSAERAALNLKTKLVPLPFEVITVGPLPRLSRAKFPEIS